ncbi:13377_t:CDS:1 [Entrophospora sp. SA101]|nr:15418_t:CDS:1 [Entrophospora sp. SA101]CAJ0894439.1 13377_t:CDS:1 [Entrophospora sp. SA101]
MPIIKKVSPSPKRFAFPPKEEFERVVKRARKSDRRTNFGLTPWATELDKAKHKLCKTIARYERENNLTEKGLAKKLGITHAKVEKILFCHIDELTFEELTDYLKELSMP